jgi:phage anti-repressor protein
MGDKTLDIVNLIEVNPLIKLSSDYQNKFLSKLKEKFTEDEQKLFVSSFYCYLNYNTKLDFVIELDTIWKWLGFSRKDPCKVVLEKHFTKDKDYIVNFAPQVGGTSKNENKAPEVAGASKIRGCAGKNKENILMTINTFKKLCLKSNTKKADEIHDYFIKLEESLQETINEECIGLKNQLQQTKTQFIQDKQIILLTSFDKKSIMYLIKITINTDGVITYIYKFGYTDDINRRIREHKKEIHQNIELIYCIESKNNTLLENKLKEFLATTDYRKEQIFNDKIQTELIEIDDISIIENKLNELNKDISEDREQLTIKRLELENQNLILKHQVNKRDDETIIKRLGLENENLKLRIELKKLDNPDKEKQTVKKRGIKDQAIKNKDKFVKWLSENIIQDKGSFLKMEEISTKFLGHNTSTQIIKIYREYLEEYISVNLPNINNKYIQKAKLGCGYRNLKLNV